LQSTAHREAPAIKVEIALRWILFGTHLSLLLCTVITFWGLEAALASEFGNPTSGKASLENNYQNARPQWNRVDVPGAVCGNGEPYAVFLRLGRADRIAFEFRGGGACWDGPTCFGPLPFASLALEPVSGDQGGIGSQDPAKSPLSDATYIVFPYCTGDVHAGVSSATYGRRSVNHFGHRNIEQSLGTLALIKGLFESVTELYLVGRSAGAIGALLHLPSFEQLFPEARKIALVDSPGLHFGDRFWQKFAEPYFSAIRDRMNEVGIQLVAEQGNVAVQIPDFCQRFANWRMGILQSLRDRVMSLLFGNISQNAHQQLVMSTNGISQLARAQMGQCFVWIHDSAEHTFLGSENDLSRRTKDVSARDFMNLITGTEPGTSTLP
jgi:hypothetical protein